MSDTSGGGFGKFVPGFEFLQNLAGQAAGGVAQGLGNSLPQLPNLGNWVAPTFNVEDLEKRIEELKAVHFWLDQNAKALGATIQALEVQKMTLATLQNMNFSLGDVANALKLRAADSVASFTGTKVPTTHTTFAGLEVPPRTFGVADVASLQGEESDDEDEEQVEAPAPAPRPRKPAPRRPASKSAAQVPPPGGVIDPLHWWGALSQQFQTIATNAMKDAAKQSTLDTTRQVASGLTEHAVKTATGVAGKVTRGLTDTVARNVGTAAGVGAAAARAVTGRKTPAKSAPAKARAAAAQPLPTGDWPLPTAFFQLPGFSSGAGPAPAKRAPAKKAVTKKAPARKTASTKGATRKPVAKKAAARKPTAKRGRR